MSRCVFPLAGVASLLLAASLEAQSARSSAIGTDIFWVHNREQNAQVSPLRYSGGGTGVGLAYGTGTDAWRAGLHMLYTSTQMQSGISQNREHAGTSRRLELSLPYERRVFAEASRLSGLTFGAQLTGDLLYRDHIYSTMLSTEHFIDAFVSLAVSAGWQSTLGAGWRLHYRAALPLLGVVWRTPYSGAKYMPDAELALPNTLLGLENRVALTHRLSAILDFRASYELQLLRHEATWDLASASNRVGLGFDWYLRRPANPSASRSTGGVQ